MSKTTEATEAPPRFEHIGNPSSLLAAPLPPRLETALPAAERKRHAELVRRGEEASRTIARLRQELDRAPAEDRERAAAAALAGEEMPEPSLDRLRRESEQAQAAKRALDDALRQSADALLAAVLGRAEAVAAEAEQELTEASEAIGARLADLVQALHALGQLYGEAGWARSLVDAGEAGRRVSPFRAAGGFEETVGKVRVVEQALAHELGIYAERRRGAADQREHQRAGERERQAERKRRAEERAAGEEAPAG
jgi:hypothetical protein